MFTNKTAKKIAQYVQDRPWIGRDDAKDFIYAAFLLETGTERAFLMAFVLDLDSDPRDTLRSLVLE